LLHFIVAGGLLYVVCKWHHLQQTIVPQAAIIALTGGLPHVVLDQALPKSKTEVRFQEEQILFLTLGSIMTLITFNSGQQRPKISAKTKIACLTIY
jgi:hypothetical protein